MTRVRRVARFLVVLNATRVPSGEIAGKIPSAIFFLTRAVEIGYPDSLVPFKRDLPIAAKN
jgi:hypothetical protein